MQESLAGLPGMYFHQMEDGKTELQGQVLFVLGGFAMVQLYSYLDGDPTHCRLWEIDGMAEHCRFYHFADDWNAAADK